MLGTCDYIHDIMTVHAAQQMDKGSSSEEKAPTMEVVKPVTWHMPALPIHAHKYQQSDFHPSQTPTTTMDRFSLPEFAHKFTPAGLSGKAIAIFLIVIAAPFILSTLLAAAIATYTCYEYFYKDKDDNNNVVRDNTQDDRIIVLPGISQVDSAEIKQIRDSKGGKNGTRPTRQLVKHQRGPPQSNR